MLMPVTVSALICWDHQHTSVIQ